MHASTPGSFALILTPIVPEVELPLELVPKHTLRRPDGQQLAILKQYVDQDWRFSASQLYEDAWESRGIGGVSRKELPPEEWRYFILEFNEQDSVRKEVWQDLVLITNITKPVLQFGAVLIPSGDRVGYAGPPDPHEYPFWFAVKWSKGGLQTRVPLGEQSIADIRAQFNLYREQRAAFPWLRTSLQMLQDLRAVPRRHPLYSLGLFSVLETLILHQPGERETGDSINRQLRSKMNLLEKRFDVPLDASAFSGNLSNENHRKKLWEALYKFRSSLAHGSRPDFKGQLSDLVSKETADRFLGEVVVGLVRVALREPDLIKDLQDC